MTDVLTCPFLPLVQLASAQLNGDTREYFIQAEEVNWDYAPSGRDMCSGSAQPYDELAASYLKPSNTRFGGKFVKARVSGSKPSVCTAAAVPRHFPNPIPILNFFAQL